MDLSINNTQKIEHLSSVIQMVVDMMAKLHQSHIELCKDYYKEFQALCFACKHEHEQNKDVEKCDKCGSKNLGFSFPRRKNVQENQSVHPVGTEKQDSGTGGGQGGA